MYDLNLFKAELKPSKVNRSSVDVLTDCLPREQTWFSCPCIFKLMFESLFLFFFRNRTAGTGVAWRTPEDGWTHWMAQATSGSQADTAACTWLYICASIRSSLSHMSPEESDAVKHGPLTEMLCCMGFNQDWLPLPEALWY